MPQPPDKTIFAATLTLLVLSLMACATPSTPSVPASPMLPAPPSLREPIPQQSYSERAQRNIRTWQQRLMGMPVTLEPSSKHGQ